MTQLALLEMTTREVKRAFNVEFAEMEAEKQKFLDKIGGINSRIADIRLELKGHTDDAGPLFEPIVSPLERENYVLSVEDDEISAEKWLSAEERATLEAAEEAERERIRAKGANPPEDRALKDMMGGRLEKAEEGGVPDELPKPDWMVEIPREEWNDEQRKQGREFENKAKVYREELAKRRAALAIELARSHEESAETVAKFDELLWEFLLRRNAVDARLAQMEADIITCAHEAETALDDDEVEEARIADALAAARGRKAETAAAAAAHRTRVDAFQRRVNACDSQNQKLEREFRRDFAEADDLFDPLLALYKRRKAPNRTEADGTPAPETARRRADARRVDDSKPRGRDWARLRRDHPRRRRSVPARTRSRTPRSPSWPGARHWSERRRLPPRFRFRGRLRDRTSPPSDWCAARDTIRSTALWAGWRRIRRVGRALRPWSPWTNGTIAPRIATIGGGRSSSRTGIGRSPRRRNCETSRRSWTRRNAARSNSPRRTRWRSPRRRRSSPRRRRTPRDASIRCTTSRCPSR